MATLAILRDSAFESAWRAEADCRSIALCAPEGKPDRSAPFAEVRDPEAALDEDTRFGTEGKSSCGPDAPRCRYFEHRLCRSCSEIALPYDEQCLRKDEHARLSLIALGARASSCVWEPLVRSASRGFRNRAKMVVSGSLDEPLLGILAEDLTGIDLSECLICADGIRASLPVLREFIVRARIPPYDVRTRRGELKYVLVTIGAEGALMVRFVLRSTEAEVRIRKHMGWLGGELPTLSVLSINLQPNHVAIIEGEEEIPVLGESLPMPMSPPGALGPILLPPGGFFQTNTEIAQRLYETAAEWGRVSGAETATDLFCGVGGFALYLGAAGIPLVRGVELHPGAVAAARRSAALWGLESVSFEAGDATARRLGDLVVVNPPRRGLGAALATSIEVSPATHLIYSSCNVETLVRDLHQLPSFRLERARVFDMFPHTRHYELLAALRRD